MLTITDAKSVTSIYTKYLPTNIRLDKVNIYLHLLASKSLPPTKCLPIKNV